MAKTVSDEDRANIKRALDELFPIRPPKRVFTEAEQRIIADYLKTPEGRYHLVHGKPPS